MSEKIFRHIFLRKLSPKPDHDMLFFKLGLRYQLFCSLTVACNLSYFKKFRAQLSRVSNRYSTTDTSQEKKQQESLVAPVRNRFVG